MNFQPGAENNLSTQAAGLNKNRISTTIVGVSLLASLLAGILLPGALWISPIMFVTSALVIAASIGPKLEPIVLGLIGLTLLGYLIQGRGFAYLGVRPLYVGEIIVGLLCLSLPFLPKRRGVDGLTLLIILFVLWGAIRTIPYLGRDGIDAIRDAALWYYAVFALFLARVLSRQQLERSLRIAARLLPYLLIWNLAMAILFRRFLSPHLPSFPGSPLPLLSVVGPGHRGVVLAMLGAFFASGLYARASERRPIPPIAFWALWLPSVGIIAVESRGGFLAIIAASGVLFFMRRSFDWIKSALAVLVLTVLVAFINPTIDLGDKRSLTINQLTANITSLFTSNDSNTGSVDDTRAWRLRIWTRITSDIFDGPVLLQGRGYGINLADYYDFQTAVDGSLRSPHNSHVTVLARSGVIGMTLWLALQLIFAWQMLVSSQREFRRSRLGWSSLFLMFLAIWTAMTVEAFFDVYYEGPQGGILMWSLLGAGIAARDMARRSDDDLLRQREFALIDRS